MSKDGRLIYLAAQRSQKWFSLRAGNVGASQAHIIGATLKNGHEPARRRDLRTQLALERVVNRSLDDHGITTVDMQRGIDREASAIAAFSEYIGELVHPVGYIINTSRRRAGVSPDGLVGLPADQLVEIKCPRPANHLAALRLRDEPDLAAVPPRNRMQLIHALLISEFPTIHFVSWCPEMPPEIEIYHVRIERDTVSHEIDAYALQLDKFLTEVSTEEAEIRTLVTTIQGELYA